MRVLARSFTINSSWKAAPTAQPIDVYKAIIDMYQPGVLSLSYLLFTPYAMLMDVG